jgi:hypothetical protein
MRPIVSLLLVAAVLLFAFPLTGCSSRSPADAVHAIPVADMATMPAMVQTAPQRVAFAYRFAAAAPDVLQQLPCYCGCGPMGHTSNYACFWDELGNFDPHALGCGICVDIAEDARRGLQQGLSLADIRSQVDADYSRFGPPTDTPPVVASTRP